MGLLENKTSIVTGGGTEIGREIARRFHLEGAYVLLCGRREERLQEACEEMSPGGRRIHYLVVDVTRKEDVSRIVEKALEKTGRIDILVNNDDRMAYGKVDRTDPSLWIEMMDTNAYAPWRLMVAALPEMRKVGGGAVVNISCIAGTTPFSGLGVYGASHAALQVLSRVMAKEVAHDNVRVNLICPAIIDCREEEVPEGAGISELRGKNGNPKDVADAALFLVSDRSSWLTGLTVDLDAGRHLAATPP
ncbi:MAG: SDR family oxidoreductase [Deltaproteobacteria bacterium]|nr:SDR family oxidoreductase [Deltaproteobacteria bacterium]